MFIKNLPNLAAIIEDLSLQAAWKQFATYACPHYNIMNQMHTSQWIQSVCECSAMKGLAPQQTLPVFFHAACARVAALNRLTFAGSDVDLAPLASHRIVHFTKVEPRVALRMVADLQLPGRTACGQ